MRPRYPSDTSESQWKMIEELLPKANSRGRRWSINRRAMIDAIFYLNRTGLPWRYLPKDYPNWHSVYAFFSKLSRKGFWRTINLDLNKKVRGQKGLKLAPALIIIDSQSVKAHYGEARGYDGFKKIRGRKRHILVDSLGLVQEAHVSKANEHDADHGAVLLEKAQSLLEERRTHQVYVDGGYRTRIFWDHVAALCGVVPEIIKAQVLKNKVKDNRSLTGTNLTPKRWIVERTFAWFNLFRRMSRDYERTVHRSESIIFIAMIQLNLRKLAT